MFNNPFDSFHNTVAEAKEEREQLNRLLTVSTPRERWLVAAIALLLAVIALWFMFGSVSRSIVLNGALIGPSEFVNENRPSIQAVFWTQAENSTLDLKPGAAVQIKLADEQASALEGRLGEFSAVPLSKSLVDFESAMPISLYRADIELNEGIELTSLTGKKCQIVFDLGDQSMFVLFKSN